MTHPALADIKSFLESEPESHDTGWNRSRESAERLRTELLQEGQIADAGGLGERSMARDQPMTFLKTPATEDVIPELNELINHLNAKDIAGASAAAEELDAKLSASYPETP